MRGKLFAKQGLPRAHRLTVWKATTLSKFVFHSATCGTMTVDNWKNVEATYRQGLRCIHAETKYTQLKYGTRNNFGVGQDVQAATIQQVVSSRRLGLLKRALDSNSVWLLGFIIDQMHQEDGPKKYAKI